jgi:sodium transport system ATP-binding protein
VWIRDRHTVDDAAAVRAQLGYLSANTGIYERLTPRELLRYFGRLHGLTRTVIEERTHTIFARLEIEEYSDRPAGQLSTGMKQKVSIARAFLHDPPVLILDEPTNGLDVLVRESLLELVRESARADRLIILSTHDLSEAEGLCDAFLFIDDGHLIAEGTREELLGKQARPLREVFFEALGRPVHAS